MAEKKEEKKEGEKKKLNLALIGQIAFSVINLAVVGGGAYLTYTSTLGWHPPSMTEASLRKPASEKKAEPKAEGESEKAQAQGAAEEHAGPGAAEVLPFVHRLDKFTVNLAGEPKRTVRLEVNLELLNERSYEEVMDVSNMPKIRDRIVAVLNDKTFSDIESIQGKLFLKERIATEVNSILDEGVVKDVFFTELVVQ